MDFRGDCFSMVISHELWVHAKGPFTPAELRMKQAVWEWYSALSPQELERVRQHPGCGDARARGPVFLRADNRP